MLPLKKSLIANLYTCRICKATDSHPHFRAREMMFGSRHEFTYFKCLHCGCLQIGEIPADMAQYYPGNYYSMIAVSHAKGGGLRRWLNALRTGHALAPKPGPGSLVRKIFGPPHLADYFYHIKVTLNSPILDVGCGSGGWLHGLYGLGFTNLTGIDSYLSQDSFPLPGLRILKREPQQLTGTYDLITMHHSFEHMAEPIQVLESLRQRMGSGSRLVIRIPLCSSYAWEKYGPDWVQLDAPRHFFLHTVKSMEFLAAAAGLACESLSYDSWEFQFWGSEQYQQDIPLFDARSWNNGPEKSIFTAEQVEAFKRQSVQLNAEGKGDQACFIFRKASPA